MTPIQIGEWEFDYADYDSDADVLYLSMGEPRPGYGEETREGHVLRYDENDEFYGLTLISVQELMNEHGSLTVTGLPRRLPREETIARDDLRGALLPA